MSLQLGTRLGNYEILSELGAGGMGDVYKARDLKLGREVAVKVLPQEMATDTQRLRRFEQEARAASALNHPNIVTIYEIGEHEDTPFIAMEYVEGKTLREILSSGPLPNEKLIRYATQMAEGLAKAHQAGIVHRDVKPENVIVSNDGYVKILDFGLAKQRPQPGADSEEATATKEGTVMGTASYMSPEQALGKALDARTDVFSLGVVVYEMATGERPFQGETLASLFDAILHKEPPPTRLSSALDAIVARSLQKDPEGRFPSAKEVLAELDSVSSGPVSGEKESIVVLPFENVSSDPEQEYFCDGVTDEILSRLSGLEPLRVISRTSSMQLKGTKKSIRDIGRDLDVHYVLEGSVRKAGNNLRITAQLIDSRNDAHLWSERYSGTLDDVFDVQEKVSRAIVEALEIALTPEENRRMAERAFDNVEAFECYHRARREMLRITASGLDRAHEDLQAGLDIVGDNVLLYAGMAEVYLQQYEYGMGAGEDTLNMVEDLSRKITALQPDSAVGYYLSGRLERFRGSFLEAAEHLEEALARDPNHSNTLLFLGVLYANQIGKTSLARPLITRLIEVDPLTALSLVGLGIFQFMEGRLDDALATFNKISKLEPEATAQFAYIAYILAWEGRHSELAALADRLVQQGSSHHSADWCSFFEAGVNGDGTAGPRTLSEDARDYFWKDPEFVWLGADAYALHGDKEEALRWLEHCVNRGWINYPLWENDPFLENVRSEPRFLELREEVKQKWESFRPAVPGGLKR